MEKQYEKVEVSKSEITRENMSVVFHFADNASEEPGSLWAAIYPGNYTVKVADYNPKLEGEVTALIDQVLKSHGFSEKEEKF